jgi:hypothetical protein
MQNLIRILIVHSVKDLFKHKSFFLLIFILAFADRGLSMIKHRYQISLGLPALQQLNMESLQFIFDRLPALLFNAITDYRVIAALVGLFFLKQIISLWPSSDMRRMHRSEREQFGIWASLTVIQWQQVVWDAIAVAFLCTLAGLWCAAWFLIHRLFYQIHPSLVQLLSLGVVISLIFPLVLGGFSFSSKLAVISKGNFSEKLSLFLKIITSPKITLWSWVFFAGRMIVESVFVIALPAYILLTVENYFLRIFFAATLATPVYSYLKMASFKFFLIVYQDFALVRAEYVNYYQMLNDQKDRPKSPDTAKT